MANSEYLQFAIDTAREAGDEILMPNYGKMQELEWTAKQHFRTEVDKMSDKFIRERIRQRFPAHNINSEENDPLKQGNIYTWFVDPIDGTISYKYGTTDHFSVSISLAKGTTPIIGVVYCPKRQELYHAEQGKGAFCNGLPIHVSLEDNINRVLMGLDGGKASDTFKRTEIADYVKRLMAPDGITCFLASGCASVPLCLTASGKLHAYAALSLEKWDMAAAVVINREAGAKVTKLNGEEWDITSPSIVIANPILHSKLLRLLNG